MGAIVVTGAARGIGRAIARHLLASSEEHKLFLIDADASELSYCANTHLAAYAPRVSWFAADLRKLEEIRTAVRKAADWFGGQIDFLVNNAGIARSYFTAGNGTMEAPETADEWDAYMSTNLSAPFFVSQACIPFMKSAESPAEVEDTAERRIERLKASRCIIHVSSFRAHFSDPNCEGYAATKSGLLGLTHAMAISGQQWGIRCNAISPGWISVKHECREGDEASADMIRDGTAPHEDEVETAREKLWADRHGMAQMEKQPSGRVGYSTDIAEAVEYLMKAGFVNGQEIIVDGGASRTKHVP